MARTPDTGSWYAATTHPLHRFPALAGDVTCDVCVVGGGYTGLSAALELAERGYDTVLLEAERIGWGASGRNGGQIITAYNPAMATIEGWVGPEDARRLWEMNEEAKALIAERIARHGIECDLRWGFLYTALKPRQQAELAELLEEWRRYGYGKARLVERQELRTLIDSPRYVGALHDAGSGQLHPLAYATGLARAAAAAGVRIFEGSRVLHIEETAGGPVCTTSGDLAGDPAGGRAGGLGGGRVAARHLALAANAYIGRLSPALARRIMPVTTSMIATAPLGAERAAALIPADAPVAEARFVLNYFRRTTDHRLLFGGGISYSGLDPSDLRPALRRRMIRVFPQLRGVGIDYCWTGLVDISVNRMPHFGRLGRSIVYAQGFSGHGVALTGLAGRLMAEAIAGTAERFDVFSRLPHPRFPGGALRMPALVLAMTYFRLRDML